MLLKNQDFTTRLRAIKNHLDSPINPIFQLIKEFQRGIIDQNRLLLYQRDIADASVYLGQFNQIATEVKRCVRDVKAFLEIIQDAIVRFYRLQFSGVHDINIQLLQNLLTSVVLKDDLYIFMQCLYSLQYKNEI